jgi:hypothetical protein
VAEFALRDGVASFLIRDSVACTIDMNAPHNSILRDRGLSARNNPGTPAAGQKGNANSWG